LARRPAKARTSSCSRADPSAQTSRHHARLVPGMCVSVRKSLRLEGRAVTNQYGREQILSQARVTACSLATISSRLYLPCHCGPPLLSKDIPQVGPLQWGADQQPGNDLIYERTTVFEGSLSLDCIKPAASEKKPVRQRAKTPSFGYGVGRGTGQRHPGQRGCDKKRSLARLPPRSNEAAERSETGNQTCCRTGFSSYEHGEDKR
jgi:hypothetical protein